jgi:hypothetical protein
MRIVAVLNPLLLHEYKLPREARVQRHEDDTTLLGVGDGFPYGSEASVGESATGNAAAVNELAIEAEGVPGMNATDVRSQRAARAPRVCSIDEVSAAIRILGDRRVGTVWSKLDWCSIWSARYSAPTRLSVYREFEGAGVFVPSAVLVFDGFR